MYIVFIPLRPSECAALSSGPVSVSGEAEERVSAEREVLPAAVSGRAPEAAFSVQAGPGQVLRSAVPAAAEPNRLSR